MYMWYIIFDFIWNYCTIVENAVEKQEVCYNLLCGFLWCVCVVSVTYNNCLVGNFLSEWQWHNVKFYVSIAILA